MGSLKDYSEFEVIDGSVLKCFMAENFVMNYSNIELQKVLLPANKKQNNSGSLSPIVPP